MSLGRTHQTSLSVNKKTGSNPLIQKIRNEKHIPRFWLVNGIIYPQPRKLRNYHMCSQIEKVQGDHKSQCMGYLPLPTYIDHKDHPNVGLNIL